MSKRFRHLFIVLMLAIRLGEGGVLLGHSDAEFEAVNRFRGITRHVAVINALFAGHLVQEVTDPLAFGMVVSHGAMASLARWRFVFFVGRIRQSIWRLGRQFRPTGKSTVLIAYMSCRIQILNGRFLSS